MYLSSYHIFRALLVWSLSFRSYSARSHLLDHILLGRILLGRILLDRIHLVPRGFGVLSGWLEDGSGTTDRSRTSIDRSVGCAQWIGWSERIRM